ncbi:hypothetical protein O0L34_g19130 [Tuta absoluta]|nr:hypothetical protein O0L34_g19130 [Tuta absoluta]
MASKRPHRSGPLKDNQIEEHLCDEESSFDESVGSDDVYVPPQDFHPEQIGSGESSALESEYEEYEELDPLLLAEDSAGVNGGNEANENLEDEIDAENLETHNDNVSRPVNAIVTWGSVPENFRPRKTIS